MFLSAPAKPERPTVEETGVDEVKVTYNFGLGGGYTHEFLVMYRKKCKHSWKCFNNSQQQQQQQQQQQAKLKESRIERVDDWKFEKRLVIIKQKSWLISSSYC